MSPQHRILADLYAWPLVSPYLLRPLPPTGTTNCFDLKNVEEGLEQQLSRHRPDALNRDALRPLWRNFEDFTSQRPVKQNLRTWLRFVAKRLL